MEASIYPLHCSVCRRTIHPAGQFQYWFPTMPLARCRPVASLQRRSIREPHAWHWGHSLRRYQRHLSGAISWRSLVNAAPVCCHYAHGQRCSFYSSYDRQGTTLPTTQHHRSGEPSWQKGFWGAVCWVPVHRKPLQQINRHVGVFLWVPSAQSL